MRSVFVLNDRNRRCQTDDQPVVWLRGNAWRHIHESSAVVGRDFAVIDGVAFDEALQPCATVKFPGAARRRQKSAGAERQMRHIALAELLASDALFRVTRRTRNAPLLPAVRGRDAQRSVPTTGAGLIFSFK